ncbi:multidrug transporter, Qdr2p [Trichosporon asahii var. asahii CBS 2479]|uniref:Multidrug transporter, Qdr2p n=1 Tax=Trichosporon asahii var. asahii (strain ATCC 90039 / CBS 2479 / JCM 2466 / KCTC 7840 / NBRC 103889/ NCYC 2677 / UAMH 7654) TaxID=1186058 RepID=J5TQS9_TRIAS|nr:multidrug transporter, Qdr2p [Trichosporon asahii var. asahii CBS 2479]EJT52221.1 multidrug transporter, Qdr2p [Trichosporon asahii var. asahii CBS 2479]
MTPSIQDHDPKHQTSDVPQTLSGSESCSDGGLNKPEQTTPPPPPPYSLFTKKQRWLILGLGTISSSGSASTIAIGSGMVGDVTTREERGGVMGIFQTGLLLPLGIGPVLGGVFAQTLGWRAIFWFLVIYAGVYLIVLVLFLPETLRSLVGDGSILPPRIARAPFDKVLAPPRHERTTASKALKLDIIAPIRIVFYPEVFVTLLFLSLHYGTWQMTITAQASLFAKVYGLNDLQNGLTFLANGFGCMLGTLTTGKILNHDYRRVKDGFTGDPVDFPIEHARLRTVWLWSPLQWFGVLLFGWTLDRQLHIAAPIVASFLLAVDVYDVDRISGPVARAARRAAALGRDLAEAARGEGDGDSVDIRCIICTVTTAAAHLADGEDPCPELVEVPDPMVSPCFAGRVAHLAPTPELVKQQPGFA